MFKSPFSFHGRIRRKEYALSILFYYGFSVLINVILFQFLNLNNEKDFTILCTIYLVLVIPVLWYLLAQGTKRCHDLGHSGWWQIIPFYFFWMLFQQGLPGPNQYGHDPKNPEEAIFSFEKMNV